MAPTKKKGAKAPAAAAKTRPARKAAAKTTGAANTKKQKTTATRSSGSKKGNAEGRNSGGAAASTKARRSARKTTSATSSSADKKRKRDSGADTRASAADAVAASVSTAIAAITTDDLKVAKKTDNITTVHKVVKHNATAFIQEWMDEDEDNETCIVDGFRKVSDGSVRKKELIARLYNQVYKKLPRTCFTKAGSKRKLNDLRARDYLTKRKGTNFCKLLNLTGTRDKTIQGDNKGKTPFAFANSHKFAITAQQNVETGKGVAASLNITEALSKDLIRLAENGEIVTQQLESFESALLFLRDALNPVIQDIDKVATLSPEEYLELCKSIDPEAEANTVLNALAQRDATSVRCQSGACLQVAVHCVATRLVERRLRAVVHKDGSYDILSRVSERATPLTILFLCCTHMSLMHQCSILLYSISIYRSPGSAWTPRASGTRSGTTVTIATSRSAPTACTCTASSPNAYTALSRDLPELEQALEKPMRMGWDGSPSATTTTSDRSRCRPSSGRNARTSSATQKAR